MQRRLITVIMFALVAAFASSTILYRIITANSAHASSGPTTQVYVASRDLTAGALIGESDVRLVRWPGVVNPLWVSRREDLVGRGLSVAINSGEPFPDNRLAAKGAGAGLASKIPQGMRIVPVHVDEQSGLSHLIAAGMHVDVLSTESKGGTNSATHTILQNVKVLSIDQAAEKSVSNASKDKPPAAQSVNLLVSPQQAEVLSQAIAQNRIQLVLRNPLDDSSIPDVIAKAFAPEAPVTRKVRSVAPPVPPKKVEVAEAPRPVPPPPPPAPPTVEIVQGTKRTVTVVAASSNKDIAQ
jgi:pilus assembly protein CpaB